MSFFTIGTISFCAIAAALTILAYKFQKSSQRIIIPSSYLFLSFPEKKSKARVYFPPRLILELIFIALIAASAISIANKNSEKKELVIFNNSLSMATAVDDESNETRLDRAKRNFIQSASADKKYKLRVLPKDSFEEEEEDSANFEDLSVISKKVSNIKNSSNPDSLALNFEKVYAQSAADKVIIYTDKAVDFPVPDQSLVSVNQVGKLLTNVYISDVEVLQDAFTDLKVEVKIGFSGEGTTSGYLEILSVANDDLYSKKIIERKKYFVQAEESSTVVFKFTRNKLDFSQIAGFEIKITDSLQRDANKIDNVAYGILSQGDLGRIFLVSNEKNLSHISATLETASQLKVETISSKLYESRVKEGELAIFYRTNFPEKFNGPSVVILPSSETEHLQFVGIAKNSKVTSYDNKNQLNRYVAFDTLQFPQTLVFKQNAWANGFIYGKSGPLALAGILDSRFVAVIGFELLPFDKERKSASDVLLLNILSVLKANQNFRLDKSRNVQTTLTCITADFNCNSLIQPLEKGIYQESDSKNFIAINNFNLAESETFKNHVVNLKLSQDHLAAKYKSFNSIPITLWLALFVLILDLILIIFYRREVSWKKESAK